MGETFAGNTDIAHVQTDEPGRGKQGKTGWCFAAVEHEMRVAFENGFAVESLSLGLHWRLEKGRLDLGVG